MPFVCSVLWMAPPAGRVWDCRTSFDLSSVVSVHRTKQMAKLCFSTLCAINHMTLFSLKLYWLCGSIKFILFLSSFFFFFLILGLRFSKHCKSSFVCVCLCLFCLVSLLPCWCSFENCLEGLEWFIAYGKICLISYRLRLETFYYIVFTNL